MAATAPPVAQPGRRPTNFPWINLSDQLGEDKGAFAVGGIVIVFTAAAALNVGDAVFLSAAFTVNKSVTAGDQLLSAGFVVGGTPRSLQDGTREAGGFLEIGDAAAAVSDPVLVCVSGVAYAVAGAAITVGALLKFDSATAGRVIAATAPTGTNGLDAGRFVGRAIDAAAGAADKIRVLVFQG